MPSYVAGSAAAGERTVARTRTSDAWKRCEGQIVQGKYRLVQYLGGSDRSGVFRIIDEAQRQNAVIKLVPASRTHPERQLLAWKTAARLSHPNLIRIFDGGRCSMRNSEFLYVVMEYAEEQLSQILPYRRLTSQELREMLEGMLSVLSYLHQHGFAHAHLKPTNVLAIGDQLKLSSDGVLRMSASPDLGQLTIYDAPEMRNTGVSPAADVWSLGMTLVEACAQRLPAWDRKGEQAPVLPEGLPSPFEEIAINSLRIETAQRWGLSEIQSKLAPAAEKPLPEEEATDSLWPGITRLKWRIVVPAAIFLALGGWFALQPRAARTPQTKIAVSDSRATDSKIIHSKPGTDTPAGEVAGNNDQPANSTVRGSVLNQVLPDVSQAARNTVQGRVRVRVKVKVDESGNVSEASFVSSGPSKYFARKAMEAARDWKFTPPQIDGRPESSEWVLRFGFGPKDTEVVPTQTSPK
jgi:eukaryotic-like serine/threonine-protein kinase